MVLDSVFSYTHKLSHEFTQKMNIDKFHEYTLEKILPVMSATAWSESPSSDDMSDAGGESVVLQMSMETLSAQVGDLLAGIEAMEAKLAKLHKPIQSIYADQLGDVPFLETSPFRDSSFKVKPPGFPGVDLKKRYKFKDITATLRTYLDTNNLVDNKGIVTLNPVLKKLFNIKGKTTTFMELIANLRNVLV
jgi:hypothetical protein